MPFVRNVNQFLTLLLDSFRSFGRVTVWLVLFSYFVLMSLILYGFYNFFSPVSYPIVRLAAMLVGGDVASRFFHYPGHFLYLPLLFGWSKTVISVICDGIFLGSAALLLRQGYLGQKTGSPRGGASILSSWPQLILAALAFNVLTLGLSAVLQTVLGPFLVGYARRSLAFEFVVLPFCYALILAIFFFVIPRIALYRESFWKALVRSFQIFLHRPFTCFFLASIILFVPVLLATAANHPDIIIEKFRPELVYWVLWLGLAADLLANFVWMGTAVRFLVDDEI